MSHYKPNPDKNVNLFIDGFPVTVPEGTTILEAARKINVRIPTLCDHPDLCKRALCRLCVVECDGRGKLVASCATDVWEGVKVVTNNPRILDIRKTIMEMLFANHAPECLVCAKNNKCELQDLSQVFYIDQTLYTQNHGSPAMRKVSGNTLTLDLRKCIKCGRCADACQEIQKVRAIDTAHRSVEYEIITPYKKPLDTGPCTYCGHCTMVCPVAAIYPHDQSDIILAALNKKEQQKAAQVSGAAAAAIAKALGLPAAEITCGKIISALKAIGFDKVYEADVSENYTEKSKNRELQDRIKNHGKLPVISGCSPGLGNFIREYYPDLLDHMSACGTPEQVFGSLARANNTGGIGTDPADAGSPDITAVSLIPCMARKYKTSYALLPAEFLDVLRTRGIDLASQPEAPFDDLVFKTPGAGDNFTDDNFAVDNFSAGQNKIIKISGTANARTVLDAIRKGECDAAAVRIGFCDECKFDECKFDECKFDECKSG
ncbi:MAG: 2Fe-2S iron-sulfur cluster-binding protein [Treponema sp.]|nr:2Fe-2S iron-sulfur cluster-binding protein [Treponema sp.]